MMKCLCTYSCSNHVELVFPSKKLEANAEEYKQEFFDHGEYVISGSALWDKTKSYDAWLEHVENNSREETVQPDWVPSSTFFGVRREDGKPMLVFWIEIKGDNWKE